MEQQLLKENEIIVDRTSTTAPESSYTNISGTTRRGVELAAQNLMVWK